VGSSAMPFKRNPINSEKIDSLARLLAQYPRVAWDNASYSILERTLDDSANRRTTLPEAFLISDELLKVTTRIINGLHVNELAIEANMERYGPFAATERVLMALGKAGADRQEMHERLRSHTLVAWENIKKEAKNPLIENITRDQYFQQYLSPENIKDLMTAGLYTGDAEKRTIALVKTIREQITDDGIDGK